MAPGLRLTIALRSVYPKLHNVTKSPDTRGMSGQTEENAKRDEVFGVY